MGSGVQDKSIRAEIKQKMDAEIDNILLDINKSSTKTTANKSTKKKNKKSDVVNNNATNP